MLKIYATVTSQKKSYTENQVIDRFAEKIQAKLLKNTSITLTQYYVKQTLLTLYRNFNFIKLHQFCNAILIMT